MWLGNKDLNDPETFLWSKWTLAHLIFSYGIPETMQLIRMV